jgi:diguanylate cyclase (GGDEF)-like protein
VVPAAIVAIAAVAVWAGVALPQSLSGLRTAGPYAVLIPALVLGWWFNRGRPFVVAASILGAVAACDLFPGAPVTLAVAVMAPLNALLAMVRAERGARYRAAWFWLALLALEGLLVYFVVRNLHAPIEHWLLRSPPVALAARLAFAAAFAAAVWRAWPEFKPIPVGNAGALAAFFLAVAWAGDPGACAAFMTAAGAILIVALLNESHQLAFNDALTGLPGRRALEERLRSLGTTYAIAMVDVDKFKQFNDTHGHDIGDQVLRLVGGRLAQVGGGGVAYRYGGEEFSVLFPGVEIDAAAGEVESIRHSIEKYRMAVRAGDRPRKAEEGTKRRGEGGSEQMLSVTVSIGLAAPGEELRTPQQVIRAADDALYRAKQGGRNRVSR